MGSFGLYGLVMVRNESDIIGDSIRNAFAQGADRVFVIDHSSVDGTVSCALDAGAELVDTWQGTWNERERMKLENSIVAEISDRSEHDHIWWLWFDADEFPRPAGGGTIRELVTRLDERIRLVGAVNLNHLPTPGRPTFLPGVHPAGYQTLVVDEHHGSFCRLGHRKHPLQRWDRHGPMIRSLGGFHTAVCDAGPIPEADVDLVIHHVQWRDRETTERHLKEDGRFVLDRYMTNYTERLLSIDAVYDHDWKKVWNQNPLRSNRGIKVIDWRSIRPEISTDLPDLS